ncbi:hypothetical protein Q0F98_19095 [Paenibacillus amylolyticus]|nr:hypothetical protein Q0F98_19095 [Paenibacillus amylolyticus]
MDRISVRFSEKKDDDASYAWVDKAGMIDAYLNLFHETGITILHPSTDHYAKAWDGEQSFHEWIRSQWDGIIIGVGDLDVHTAEHAIGKGSIDLAAFGRPFIANPDLVHKLNAGEQLVEYDATTHLPVLV